MHFTTRPKKMANRPQDPLRRHGPPSRLDQGQQRGAYPIPTLWPFWYAVEVGSVYAPLQPYAANQLSNGLFRIGKGQLSAGIIGFFQCPQMTKHQAGGNDQVQRGAMLNGGSKNDHAAVARSEILTAAYVATTQVLPYHCMSWEYPDDSHDAPPHGREEGTASMHSGRSHYSRR